MIHSIEPSFIKFWNELWGVFTTELEEEISNKLYLNETQMGLK